MRTTVVGVLRTLSWSCSTPWLLSSLLHMLVLRWRWGVSVVEVVLLPHSWEQLSLLGLEVVHCQAHSVQAQIPMLRRTLQSRCCRILVWGVVWGSLCFLFQQVLQTCCEVACKLLGPWRLGVVCKLLLLGRWWCWWCIWGCYIVVSISLLLQLLLLHQAALRLWALLLLFLLWIAVVERCCPSVGPCMLRTYTSILQMLHSSHRMLEVSISVWVCVLMLERPLLMLLLLAILCHVPLPSLLSRVPHAMFSWDQALLLCACCLSVCLLGCYPVLILL